MGCIVILCFVKGCIRPVCQRSRRYLDSGDQIELGLALQVVDDWSMLSIKFTFHGQICTSKYMAWLTLAQSLCGHAAQHACCQRLRKQQTLYNVMDLKCAWR